MKYDPRSGTGKPGIAIMIGVKPSKKDDKKKYGGADGAQPHNVMKNDPYYEPIHYGGSFGVRPVTQTFSKPGEYVAPEVAAMGRHKPYPKAIDMAMRGIGPAKMRDFGEELNLMTNYDINEMMHQHEEDAENQRAREAAQAEAEERERREEQGNINPSTHTLGGMTPQEYQVWRERAHSQIPQEPEAGLAFEQRLADREMQAKRNRGHNPVTWASEAAKSSAYADLPDEAWNKPMAKAWGVLKGE